MFRIISRSATMQGFLATLLSAVLAALQVAAFAAMAFDKFKARTGRWRTRERDLLILGALGPFGFVCGLVFCAHKTRKPAFLAMGIGSSVIHLLFMPQQLAGSMLWMVTSAVHCLVDYPVLVVVVAVSAAVCVNAGSLIWGR